MKHAITLIIAKTTLGGALALGFAAMPHALAHIDTYDAHVIDVGDDNGDGIITEDESGWSCVDDGNKVCGYRFALARLNHVTGI